MKSRLRRTYCLFTFENFREVPILYLTSQSEMPSQLSDGPRAPTIFSLACSVSYDSAANLQLIASPRFRR